MADDRKYELNSSFVSDIRIPEWNKEYSLKTGFNVV